MSRETYIITAAHKAFLDLRLAGESLRRGWQWHERTYGLALHLVLDVGHGEVLFGVPPLFKNLFVVRHGWVTARSLRAGDEAEPRYRRAVVVGRGEKSGLGL